MRKKRCVWKPARAHTSISITYLLMLLPLFPLPGACARHATDATHQQKFLTNPTDSRWLFTVAQRQSLFQFGLQSWPNGRLVNVRDAHGIEHFFVAQRCRLRRDVSRGDWAVVVVAVRVGTTVVGAGAGAAAHNRCYFGRGSKTVVRAKLQQCWQFYVWYTNVHHSTTDAFADETGNCTEKKTETSATNQP